MSYNGIGLKSAKGSSTSGHIQRSLANNDEHSQTRLKNYTARRKEKLKDTRNRLNEGIRKTTDGVIVPQESMIKHLNRRQIEVAVSELRDKLEEDEVEEKNIDSKCDELRTRLLKQFVTEKRVSNAYKTRSERSKENSESSSESEKHTK